MKNTPKSIFLQISEDVDTADWNWNEIHPQFVSWDTERVNENDLEYVLAFALKENSEQLTEPLTEPKPITPEMLQAYGFEKNDMGEGEAYYSLRLSDDPYCDLALIDGDRNGCMEVCLFPYEDFFRVRYEHEMLAMYKGITGKDLVANFSKANQKNEITKKQFLQALSIVNNYKRQIEKQYFFAKQEVNDISKFADVTKETTIVDTDLSVRCLNVLAANENRLGVAIRDKVKDLSNLSIKKFLSCNYAGKKTAEELKELCFYAGVELMP